MILSYLSGPLAPSPLVVLGIPELQVCQDSLDFQLGLGVQGGLDHLGVP